MIAPLLVLTCGLGPITMFADGSFTVVGAQAGVPGPLNRRSAEKLGERDFSGWAIEDVFFLDSNPR